MSARKIATINDVARLAGVSITTVSRAMNGTGPVRADVKTRVEEAAAALGYIPARAAQMLSRQRSHTLGAIIPTLDYSIFARKIDAFQRQAERRGYNILIAVSDFDPEVELRQCTNLIRSGAEGLLLEGGLHSPELYALLASRHVPYVNTSTFDAAGPHPTIGFSNRAIAAKATQYLLDLGHRRIGVMAARTTFNDRASERIEGVRERLARQGLELAEDCVVECRFVLADARRAFRQLMALADPPTAIVCTNDQLALGGVLEAPHLGISIPGDVSIMGFDDLDWASHLQPSLTTMYVPTAEIGHAAADFLVGRLEGGDPAGRVEIDVDLIVRESTAPARRGRLSPQERQARP